MDTWIVGEETRLRFREQNDVAVKYRSFLRTFVCVNF